MRFFIQKHEFELILGHKLAEKNPNFFLLPEMTVYGSELHSENVWSENKIVWKNDVPDNLGQNIWDALR